MSDAQVSRGPMSGPRYMHIPTFMRTPLIADASEFDIAFVGVPYDGAVTNRPGARHGPREIRNASSMMRAAWSRWLSAATTRSRYRSSEPWCPTNLWV